MIENKKVRLEAGTSKADKPNNKESITQYEYL